MQPGTPACVQRHLLSQWRVAAGRRQHVRDLVRDRHLPLLIKTRRCLVGRGRTTLDHESALAVGSGHVGPGDAGPRATAALSHLAEGGATVAGRTRVSSPRGSQIRAGRPRCHTVCARIVGTNRPRIHPADADVTRPCQGVRGQGREIIDLARCST
ncbi:hypothetical protein GCM10028814_28210 [Angustibacter aerolatus]